MCATHQNPIKIYSNNPHYWCRAAAALARFAVIGGILRLRVAVLKLVQPV